jgi:hypothetical protein
VTLRRAIAYAHRALGDTAAALGWFDAMASEAGRLGMSALEVEAIAATAHIRADLGDVDDALGLIAQARSKARAARSEHAEAWVDTIEGSILLRADPRRASDASQRALEASRHLGYAAGVSNSLRALALAALLDGRVDDAARLLVELLEELMNRGATHELRAVFDVASAVLEQRGNDAAADLAATAMALPVVAITASVGYELFVPQPRGHSPLPVRDAILLTRAELTTAAPAVAAPVRSERSRAGTFRPLGDVWEVEFDGRTVTMRATKGMTDIAQLLRRAEAEIHCLELVGAGVDEGDTGPVLDPAARRAYETRARELQADIDEADANHDRGRAERARTELDALVDELAAALGIGGRTRRTGSSSERARSTVTQRLRATIKRIDAVHPPLGRHLDASVRTGVFCSYRPEQPVQWTLD